MAVLLAIAASAALGAQTVTLPVVLVDILYPVSIAVPPVGS